MLARYRLIDRIERRNRSPLDADLATYGNAQAMDSICRQQILARAYRHCRRYRNGHFQSTSHRAAEARGCHKLKSCRDARILLMLWPLASSKIARISSRPSSEIGILKLIVAAEAELKMAHYSVFNIKFGLSIVEMR